jgi:adenylylsulfate kinase
MSGENHPVLPENARWSYQGTIVWLTGLSGSGKTTLAHTAYEELQRRGFRSEVLDADVLRKSLTRDLGFSREAREENVRRIGIVAELLSRHGVIVFVAAITPYRAMREEIRKLIPTYIEVYVDAPLDVCESRDPKGLYRKARSGAVSQFTGIDDPYEPPLDPDIHCRTALESVNESAAKIVSYVLDSLKMPLASSHSGTSTSSF